MRILRNGFLGRFLSIFLLTVFVQSLLAPYYAMALTTGPEQMEYMQYSEPGKTDMVNTLTGDFSFDLPVLNVPGPEGGFQMPLAYNAGISLDQEASWVGLGWSMNAGAIVRSVNEYPDDASGQSHTITVQDLEGLRGWDSNIIGIGKMGWNNIAGHYGHLSLLSIVNAQWSEGHSSVGLIGMNVTDKGYKFNPVQFGLGVATLLTWGAAGAAAGEGVTFFGEVGKQIAISSISSVASDQSMSLAMGGHTPHAPTSGSWAYSKWKNMHIPARFLTGGLLHVKEYKVWLDQTRNERMYGTLYLGNVPVDPVLPDFSGHVTLSVTNAGVSQPLYSFTNASNDGGASDINYQLPANDDLKKFQDMNNPATVANDNFSVKAPGISGTITPYRLDIGSVSMPRAMVPSHLRLAPLTFLANDANYKVPFIYEGQRANSYIHHVGGATSVTSPKFYFGISTALENSNPNLNDDLTYELNDVIFNNQRVRSDLSQYKKIPQPNYIEWYSNDEIKSLMTFPSKFMDYFSPGTGPSVSPTSDRYLQRAYVSTASGSISASSSTSNFSLTIPVSPSDITKFNANDFVDLSLKVYDYPTGTPFTNFDYKVFQVAAVSANSITLSSDSRLFPFFAKSVDIQLLPRKTIQAGSSIGGFSITAQDGSTYHFALSASEYDQFSEVHDVAFPTTKKSTVTRQAPFANTWLLTGITGSDFIDRNENGVIDESDWGRWIKFNYGLYSSDYTWRLPYQGFRKLPDGTHETYSQGKKQIVYLNSIETRSHVGLFIKSSRLDGRGAAPDQQSTLKLDEIVLLSREHYKKLGLGVSEGGFGLPQYSNKSSEVLTGTSISTDGRNFIDRNCLKRILFNYTYELAPNTLNSNGPSNGKLTLSKLSIVGRNGYKIVPDYKFGYSSNPSYNSEHWDDWGMFNNGGISPYAHAVSNSDADGSAWSLTKITTPLGGEINVNYERDTYGSVSGLTISNEGRSFSNQNFDLFYPSQFPAKRLTIDPTGISPGDSVSIQGYVTYSSPQCSAANKAYTKNVRVVSVGSNYIDVGIDFMEMPCTFTTSGQSVHIEGQAGAVYLPLKNKKGEGIRVGSITTSDEFQNQGKIRYIYENDDGTSSGVLAKLPYMNNTNYWFTTYIGYPETPVLYKKVSVLGGSLTTDADYVSKHVYEFETPHYSQLGLTQSVLNNATNIKDNHDFLTVFWNRFDDRTAAIGRLNSIKVYDKNQALTSSTTMVYTDQMLNDGVNNYQGYYTSGTIMFDRLNDNSDQHHKVSRTTVIKYPSVLKEVINSKDGLSNKSTNVSWDFYTGDVVEKLSRSPLGIFLKSVHKPAYLSYPELGPKALNPSNVNMMALEGSSYVFRSDALGSSLGIISGTAQTWKKDWQNYRLLNSGAYSDDNAPQVSVWRKDASYIFKGDISRLQADYGTQDFSSADQFNSTASNPTTSNPLWQFVAANRRFDHFSMPLESVDKDNLYSAVKMGYDGRSILASASNAQYKEIAFSSAEDKISNEAFFGGEVGLGSGAVVTDVCHTGFSALSVASGHGFVFKSNEISTSRTYKASVWANSVNGRIYYKLNDGAEVVPSTQTISPAVAIPGMGNWYRIDMTLANPASSVIEIGVKSNAGTTVFDDFRFQPRDAVMTCYVTPPLDFEFTGSSSVYSPSFSYSLDNDNLFTKVESNEKGEQVKVYTESITYGVKLISESKSNYRRNTVNP